MHLTQRLRKVNVAFEEMEVHHVSFILYPQFFSLRRISQQYMAEIISDRKNHSGNEKKYDLLSGLLDASEGEFDGDGKLTDSEVLGE